MSTIRELSGALWGAVSWGFTWGGSGLEAFVCRIAELMGATDYTTFGPRVAAEHPQVPQVSWTLERYEHEEPLWQPPTGNVCKVKVAVCTVALFASSLSGAEALHDAFIVAIDRETGANVVAMGPAQNVVENTAMQYGAALELEVRVRFNVYRSLTTRRRLLSVTADGVLLDPKGANPEEAA